MTTIVTSKDIQEVYQSNGWVVQAWNEIRSKITDENYPCYFAKRAEERGSLYYSFVNSAVSLDDLQHLTKCLWDFTNLVKGSDKKARFTLLVVFKPEFPQESNLHYSEIFWSLLEYLHTQDKEAWPPHVSTDPNNGDFEFCFNGVSLFTFVNTPAYRNRLSRNLGRSFVIVFVPASSFFGVKLLTPGGIAARMIIHERIKKYDLIDRYPEFGKVDEGIPLSWKSYFIPDENTPLTTECPFKVRKREV